MKKVIKAGLLGLALVLASSGIILVEPSATVAAKSYEKKTSTQVIKKKLAELAKIKTSLEQEQGNLLDKLQTGQDQLIDQLLGIFGDPSALNAVSSTSEPAASPNPPATSTNPVVTTDTTYTDEEIASFYFDALTMIANQDPSIADYFDPAVLDELSGRADELLTLNDNADSLSASYDKLDQNYNDYMKQSKYPEALNVLVQEIKLAKKLNETYNSMISIQAEISTVINDGFTSSDSSNVDEQGDHQNNDENHGN